MNDRIKMLVERINIVNNGAIELDVESKCFVTIALIREWLEYSTGKVNEGVLFTLFNSIGPRMFNEHLELVFDNEENLKVVDKERKTIRFKFDNPVDGYDSYLQYNKRDELVRYKVSKNFIEVFKKASGYGTTCRINCLFDDNGIETLREYDMRTNNSILYNPDFKCNRRIILQRDDINVNYEDFINIIVDDNKNFKEVVDNRSLSIDIESALGFVNIPGLDSYYSTGINNDSYLNVDEDSCYSRDCCLDDAFDLENKNNLVFQKYFPELYKNVCDRIEKIQSVSKGHAK